MAEPGKDRCRRYLGIVQAGRKGDGLEGLELKYPSG